jgi:hypothetical protein
MTDTNERMSDEQINETIIYAGESDIAKDALVVGLLAIVNQLRTVAASAETDAENLRYTLAQLRTENEDLKKSLNACGEHQPTGGTRASCLVCAVQKLSHAISRMDYACGEPNEMGVSPYDLHYDEDKVVARVEKMCTENAALREAIDRARECARCNYPKSTAGFAPWEDCGECVGCQCQAALAAQKEDEDE